MPDDVATLNRITAEISDAESTADAAYFTALLSPRFVIGRPDGTFDSKDTFLAALSAGAERVTQEVEVTVLPANRAVVTCVVTKRETATGAAARRFHNLRVFTRTDPTTPWHLLTWLAEPATAPGSAN